MLYWLLNIEFRTLTSVLPGFLNFLVPMTKTVWAITNKLSTKIIKNPLNLS